MLILVGLSLPPSLLPLPSSFSAAYPLLKLCDGLVGRTFAVAIYYVSLQYGLEVVPTAIRGTGAAACEIFGGLGVFICPQIVYLVRAQPMSLA